MNYWYIYYTCRCRNFGKRLYFQDHQMRSIFSAYPELLCVDATYKLLDLRLPLYIMLVEDGNGQSEVAAAFLLVQETEESLLNFFDVFKKHNPSWPCTRVLMTDKDISERETLKKAFQMLVC